MKLLKNGIIRRWILTGMAISCLLAACGFFIIPVIIQLIEIHNGPIETVQQQVIPEPPLNSDKNFWPPQE